MNIATIRYVPLTSQYIALSRILDMTKHKQNNYTCINILEKMKAICFMKKEQTAMHLVAIEEKVYLRTYGFNIKAKTIKEKKEVLEVLIHLS